MQLTVNHLFNYLYTMLVINRAIVMLIMYGRAGFEFAVFCGQAFGGACI